MDSSKSKRKLPEKKATPINMDISIRFFDSFSRSMDAFKKSLDVVHQRYYDQDAAVNFGVGHMESQKLTHGISQGRLHITVISRKTSTKQ